MNVKRISELLEKVGATELANDLRSHDYTALQAVQKIYNYQRTPKYVKEVIDEKAKELNLMVGKRYIESKEKSKRLLQQKIEELENLKPYTIVKSKWLSSISVPGGADGYGIFLGLKREKGEPKAKVLIWYAGKLSEEELKPQDVVVFKNQTKALNKLLEDIKRDIQYTKNWKYSDKETKQERLLQLNRDLNKVLYYADKNVYVRSHFRRYRR